MGYSHYWYQQKDFTPQEWGIVTETVKAILQANIACHIAGWDGTGWPEIDAGIVRLNGVGGQGCETFYLEAKLPPPRDPRLTAGFNFCKTNRMPYDVVVVAILVFLFETFPEHYRFRDEDTGDWLSDGDIYDPASPESQEGRELLKRAKEIYL